MSVFGSTSLLVGFCCANWDPGHLLPVIRTGKASNQCLGHQQNPTISSFHHCLPEQNRGDATGSQAPSSEGGWCYYYFPLTLESNSVVLCAQEAAASHHSSHLASRQKRKPAFYAVRFQFLPGNSNWSPTQLWLTAQYIKYCVFKLNLENKLLFAPREHKTWARGHYSPPSRD